MVDPGSPSPLKELLKDPGSPSPLRDRFMDGLRELVGQPGGVGIKSFAVGEQRGDHEVPVRGTYAAFARDEDVTLLASDIEIGGLRPRAELRQRPTLAEPLEFELHGYVVFPQLFILSTISADPIDFKCELNATIVRVHDRDGVHDVVIQRGLL